MSNNIYITKDERHFVNVLRSALNETVQAKGGIAVMRKIVATGQVDSLTDNQVEYLAECVAPWSMEAILELQRTVSSIIDAVDYIANDGELQKRVKSMVAAEKKAARTRAKS